MWGNKNGAWLEDLKEALNELCQKSKMVVTPLQQLINFIRKKTKQSKLMGYIYKKGGVEKLALHM